MKTAFCFDLDGTITQEEIIPLIAQDLDLQEEFQVLTTATVEGLLPFSGSFKLRCKLLADVPISRAKSIISQIKLFEKVVALIQQNKQCSFVVTGNLDVWIEDLVNELGCGLYSSKASYKDDRFTGISKIIDKGEAIEDIRSKGFDRIIAVGDGMGDIDMFRKADISIFFSENHTPTNTLKNVCDYLIFDEVTLLRILDSFL